MTYLRNTLESKFNLNPEFHKEFRELFINNCKELGLTSLDDQDIGTTSEIHDSVEQIELTTQKQNQVKQSQVLTKFL